MTELTISEWHLVKCLLNMYEETIAASDYPCRRGCSCPRCRAIREAKNHNVATFDQLFEKASKELNDVK